MKAREWLSVVDVWQKNDYVKTEPYSGIILVMGSANERQRYNVVSSLIGWAHTQKVPLLLYFQSHYAICVVVFWLQGQ